MDAKRSPDQILPMYPFMYFIHFIVFSIHVLLHQTTYEIPSSDFQKACFGLSRCKTAFIAP